MKTLTLIILISVLGSSQVFAVGDEGFNSPQSAATAFLQPLTKGPSGVSESVKALPGENAPDNKLIAEAKKDAPVRPMEGLISAVMKKGGKLMYYRKTSEEVKLGGKMVKQYYDLYFQNGPKKELVIVLLQPTLSGGYHIMDAQINDELVMTADPTQK